MVIIEQEKVKEEGDSKVFDEVITISKFKATCLAVLEKVKRTGKPVLVTKRGQAVATINPPPEPERPPQWLGTFKSTGKIAGDIVTPVLDEGEWETLKG